MYEFPRLEVASGQERVHAQIIGISGLAKKIQSLLKNQEITAVLSPDFPDRPYLPESPLPDFVYWFLTQNSRKLPQTLANFLKSSQAKLIIISDEPITNEPMNQLTNELLTNLLDLGIDACQVFVKDVYGPSVDDGDLSSIWRDLKTKFVINLPDDDDAEIYPVFIDDAVAAVIKISFSTQTYGRTFFITGSDKITILSFSYRLREEVVRQTQKLPAINYISTSLRVPTLGRDVAISFFLSSASATRDFLNWHPDTDLSEGLRKLVSGVCKAGGGRSENLSVEPVGGNRGGAPRKGPLAGVPGGWRLTGPTPSKLIKKKTTLHFRRGFVIPVVLATAFFAATLSLPPLLDSLAAALAKNSPDRLARFEPIFVFLGRRPQFDKLRQDVLFDAALADISQTADRLILSMFPNSPDSPVEILDRLESDSTRLIKDMAVGERRADLSLARELIPVARQVLAADRKQTFAVVFQNSAELRPAGGFISSLAFVTLQKGKILDIDYQQVYQLDSQLVGVEPPPEPIKNYLGETNWLIRDSNWSADVRQSAQKLQNLIGRAAGRNLDGVVFLATPALRQILAQTGDLPDLPDTPDSRVWNQFNVADRLVYNDRDAPFISLAKALEQFIKANPRRRLVISGILSAIRQNDLSIFSADPAAAQILNRLQADGALPPLACPLQLTGENCLADQIAVVDANLGGSKADYFMIKEHDISVSLSAAQISTALTLRYQNAADSSQYPAGTYRNYVRVYLPPDSVVTSVVRITPDGLVAVPTQNSMESGYKIIGWFMEIPVAGQEIFRLEFVRPQKLTFQNQTAAYSLAVRKQPGTAIPTSVSIGYPPSLAPLTVSDQVAAAAGKLLLNHSGENNLTLNVEFATTE